MQLRSLTVAFSLMAPVAAQLSISHGNMNAVFGALSAVTQDPQSLVLRADPLATNHGVEQGWYYRIAGDTREFALRQVGPVTEAIVGGVHADRDFANVDQRYQLRASLDHDIYDAGPTSGVVMSRLTLQNRSPSPLTVSVYCYTDVDAVGTASNDTCTGTTGSHFVVDPIGVQIEVRGVGADHSQMGPFPTVRDLLTNAAVDNLPTNPVAYVGDYTGAFEWQDRVLQPLEFLTFTVAIAVDSPALGLPLVENYGASNGINVDIHATDLPLQDLTQPRTFTVRTKGALRFVEQRLIIGLASTPALPFIPGLDFLVHPSSIFGVFANVTNADGETADVFAVPPAPYFSGFSVYFQSFVVDPSAPNGYAFESPGLRVRVGKI